MSDLPTTIPKGSWVLLTGITGHIASHTAKLFLERGFKVRGTVRDRGRAAWLTQDVFKSYADRGDLELVLVPDLGAKHAFDEAMKGVSAIALIASKIDFTPDPNEVIPPVVDSINSVLEAALNEPSVKSVVYTSSIGAAVDFTFNLDWTDHVGPNTYNDSAVERAWAPPPYSDALRGHTVYLASKVEAEKAFWAFVEKRKPPFAANVVSPSTVMGEAFTKTHLLVPGPWIKSLLDGDQQMGDVFQAIVHIDVKDSALLHVAAVLDPECINARLQAWGECCNMNDILAILRRLYPQRKFMDDFSNQKKLRITADLDQPLALLKKWGGQDGFRSLEQTVTEEAKSVVKFFPET